MPFRKRSIREQRRMAKELRRLQQLERIATSGYAGSTIVSGPVSDRIEGALVAALALGHQVRVTAGSGGSFVFRAVRFE